MLRALHGIVMLDGAICFHGSPAGANPQREDLTGLRAPARGLRWRLSLDRAQMGELATLLEDAYWRAGREEEERLDSTARA